MYYDTLIQILEACRRKKLKLKNIEVHKVDAWLNAETEYDYYRLIAILKRMGFDTHDRNDALKSINIYLKQFGVKGGVYDDIQ